MRPNHQFQKIRQLFNPQLEEELPVRVKIVRTVDQLDKAIDIRASAYDRHMPEFGLTLRNAENDDKSISSLILLCESKLTGDPVGTLRIHTNEFEPTCLEKLLDLPDLIKNSRIAYVTRLGVAGGTNGNYVKLLLFKALFHYCLAMQIPWILAVARSPIDRNLLSLGFQDILTENTHIKQLQDFGDCYVRPLYLNVIQAESQWKKRAHPLYNFMIERRHPDIKIFTSVSSSWSRPRRRSRDNKHDLITVPAPELFIV